MKYLFLVLLLLSFVNCLAQSDVKKTNFRIDITGTIDQSTTDKIVASPSKVITDSKGNIYLWDRKFASIRVFNRQGKFVKQIGRSGRGPEEFREISAITVNDKDQLVVYDRYQLRFTVFENTGSNFFTYSFPGKALITPWCLQHSDRYGYILCFRNYNNPENDVGLQKSVHILKEDFSGITNSFVAFSDFGNTSEPFERALFGTNLTYEIVELSNGSLLLAPVLYRGTLFLYQKSNGEWKLVRRISGHKINGKPYKLLPLETAIADYASEAVLISNEYGRYAAIINSQSMGLFQRKDNTIVHFFFSRADDQELGYVYAEIYNKDFKLMKIGKVNNLQAVKNGSVYSITELDKKGNFYVIDSSDQQSPRVLFGKLTEQ